MNRRLGVALAIAFAFHAVLFTLLHVRVGPAKKPIVPAPPTELEMTDVALGEGEPAAEISSAGGARAVARPAGAGVAIGPASGSRSAPESVSDSATDTVVGDEHGVGDGDGHGVGDGVGAGAGHGVGSGAGSAAGTGAGTGVGAEAGNRVGSGARVDRAALLGQILARVRAARRYPEAARRRELEGTVHVRFTIGTDGSPRAISTGNADPLLEDAAKEAIERAAPLPVVDGPIELDVDYTLND